MSDPYAEMAASAVLPQLIQAESSGHAGAIGPQTKSGEHAVGLTQLMPGTAADLGVQDRADPYDNMQGGKRYLTQLVNKYGDLHTALVAYNWGQGNVDKHGIQNAPQGSINYADGIIKGGQTPTYYDPTNGSTTPPAGDVMADPYAAMADKARSQQNAQQPAKELTLLERFKASTAKAYSDYKSLQNNVGNGVLAGAAGIGATLLRPVDAGLNTLGVTDMTNVQRRTALDDYFKEHADTASLPFKGGELAAQVAGTAGVGGVIGKTLMTGVKFAPTLIPKIASAIESGGFATNAPAAAKMLSLEGLGNAAVRVGGGVVSGGAMAGLVNPKDAGNGSLIGGAIPVVGKVLGGAGHFIGQRIVNPILSPDKSAIEKIVQDAGGVDQAKAAIEKAIGAGKTISGESYTLGQAGKNAGLSSTERARSAVNPENFQAIYQSQREARLSALKWIGQDEFAVNDAIANRDSAANVLYGKAFSSDAQRRELAVKELADRVKNASGGIPQVEQSYARNMELPPISEGLAELAKRPEFKTAIQQAKTNLANKGVFLDNPTQSLQGLHYIKLALDDALNPNAATPLGRNASAAVMDMRNKLAEELTNLSPLYGNARSTYADMSTPINQMKVAQRLTDVLTGGAYEHGSQPQQLAASFYRALKNAPSIAKQETGMRQPLNKIFDPEQLDTIKSVAREISKDVDLQNLGRGAGSDTAQKLVRGDVAGNLLSDLVNSNKYSRVAASVLGGAAKFRVNKQLDQMLQNPESAKLAIEAMKDPVKANKLSKLLTSPVSRSLPVLSTAN